MSEIVYGVSVLLYFIVVKVLTTYGYVEKESSYYRNDSTKKVPYARISEMPIPRLIMVVIIGFIPVINTILSVTGFIYASARGFGPTPADIRAWFAGRRANKAQKAAAESESS